MFRLLINLLLFATASSVNAQDWNLRSMNLPLNETFGVRPDANTLATDNENSLSQSSDQVEYKYAYENSDDASFGIFRLGKSGRVCVNLRDGRDTCDLYLHSKGMMVTLAERGGRFPIQVQLDLRP
jgi:hypothetical protein